METIKEFLESDIYLRIIKELGADNFYKKPESIEIELLRERLKQRQYLLEGFSCKPYSEKELVEFYKQTIDENRSEIIIWSRKFQIYSRDTAEEYPDGEYPNGEEITEEEESKIISMGKYIISSVAMYIIEFDILKNHSEILPDYYKRLRIPGAAKYSKEMKKLYKELFGETEN